MVQMAHHLPNNNPHGQHSQNPFMAVRRPVNFSSVSRREFGQLSPEELLAYNRELAKARETETQEWIARQKRFDLNAMRPEAKRELMAQSEEVRKHLEKDAYFRANQEYLRLMSDEPSRQTFREKQRLTEDLEKQKRLLIEDLARDQQLKQDKYKRNHAPAYATDMRTLHYLNEKSSREMPHPLRIKPEVHVPQFPGMDPRYPKQLNTAEDFHNYRRMQESMLKAKQFHAANKHPLDPRHCSHSDFTTRAPEELGPIIQEKEKRIKEMEQKLIRLEQQEKRRLLKKIEAVNHQQLQQKGELKNAQQYQPPIVYRPSTTSPPKPLRERTPPSSIPPPTSAHSVTSLCNSNEQLLTNNNNRESNQHREASIIDSNNNSITNDKHIKNEQMLGKIVEMQQQHSPKKEKPNSPAEHSNSSSDGLIIDMADEKQADALRNDKEKNAVNGGESEKMEDKNNSPPTLSRSDSNCIKIETTANAQDDSVTTEVVDDDKSFNELKYGASVRVSPAMEEAGSSPMAAAQNVNEEDDETDSKNGGDNQEQEGGDQNNANRIQKRKKGQKLLGKKEESSSPQDFQASQNRLALDLPGHNWLEKRLMQQSMATNEIPVKTKEGESVVDRSEEEEEGVESKIEVLSYMSLRDPNQQFSAEVTKKSPPPPVEEELTDPQPPSESDQCENKNNSSSVTKTEKKTVEQKEHKSKEPPHSELLLQMLDPSKTSSQVNNSARTNQSSLTSTRMSPQKSSELQSGMFADNAQINGSRKSPIVINDLSASAPPLLTNAAESKISPRSEEPRLRSNSDSKITDTSKPDISYQEVRPNLVVERRKDPENSQLPFILPKTHQYASHPSENMPYSKFIVEERYNRKRPMDEGSKEDQDAALKRAEFSERFFSDLERGMSSRGKTEMTVLGEHKDSRLLVSESVPATLHRHSMEELPTKERLAKMEGTDYNYLSRFKESTSQPPLSYKASDLILKSPTASRIPKAASEYSVPHHLKRQTSPPQHLLPSASFRTHEEISIEKALHRRGSSVDGLPPILNGRLDASHLIPPHHRPEGVDPILMREREMKILEEARRREEIHRSAMEAANHKERHFSQSVPVSKLQTYKPLPSPEEHLLNLNDKVRTVEDLRALQMGMPLANGFQRYIRPAQILRNERLTEREKLALREADLIHQASIRQESMTSRQDIHNAYLKNARRKASLGGKLTSPTATSSAASLPSHGFSEEQIRIASIRRQQQEEEEKFRSAHERIQLGGGEPRDPRDPYSIPKEMEYTHFDPTIPRFFSHKIPRTRDGSLDFGRSKPVDYSFLDYSNPGFREREAALHNPLKRPSSAHTSVESVAKLQRRSPPQDYPPINHRLLETGGKHPGRSEVNPYEEKWRVLEGSEKRFCSICNKDAQYLCSGCRRVWYCSQDCQLNAWKTHSKTCALAAER